MIRRWRVCVLLVTLLTAAFASAHEQKASITRVLFNERTQNIEVMHRFLLHDVEHASRKLFGESTDLLGEIAHRDRFETYVHERFELVDQHGTAIELTPVGNEIDGQYIWVYAEAAIPEGLSELTLSHHALRDVWPEQSNLVNVSRDQDLRSATFSGQQTEFTIAF